MYLELILGLNIGVELVKAMLNQRKQSTVKDKANKWTKQAPLGFLLEDFRVCMLFWQVTIMDNYQQGDYLD